jgi:BirA family biotin operon repressor/biotin-[acetyl-CoA-carboxylase] ligase
VGEPLDLGRLGRLLTTREFGRPTLGYESVGSTNDEAKRLALSGAPSGTVVVAEEQTAGRGRMDRTWVSPRGLGLWFTLILRPVGEGPAGGALLTLLAGVSAAGALRQDAGVPVQLKWPNDLVVGDRKLGGILAEGRQPAARARDAAATSLVSYALLGIGVNVAQRAEDFPADLLGAATSLRMETGRTHDRTFLLASFLNSLEAEHLLLLNEGADGLLARYRLLCSTLGREVTAHFGERFVSGLAAGITSEGGLVLRLTGTLTEVVLPGGEVTLRPRATARKGGEP